MFNSTHRTNDISKWFSGYDRFTDQTDKSADFAEFADYRYYRSHKPQYRIGIGSAD